MAASHFNLKAWEEKTEKGGHYVKELLESIIKHERLDSQPEYCRIICASSCFSSNVTSSETSSCHLSRKAFSQSLPYQSDFCHSSDGCWFRCWCAAWLTSDLLLSVFSLIISLSHVTVNNRRIILCFCTAGFEQWSASSRQPDLRLLQALLLCKPHVACSWGSWHHYSNTSWQRLACIALQAPSLLFRLQIISISFLLLFNFFTGSVWSDMVIYDCLSPPTMINSMRAEIIF